MVPGAKFSMSTSAVSTRSSSAWWPASVFRSSTTLRLLELSITNSWDSVGWCGPITTICVSSPNEPPKPSRKSIGTPTTSARSAPLSPAPRAREKNIGWSAGTQPRARPLRKTGTDSSSQSRTSACSPRDQ